MHRGSGGVDVGFEGIVKGGGGTVAAVTTVGEVDEREGEAVAVD